MLRACLVVCVLVSLGSLAGCGSSIPQHSGYKTKSPWKKPKPLVFDDKLEAKAKGELSYADYKRAKWLAIDLPEDGILVLDLEFAPTDDAGDATVAMEVLDAGFNVIAEDEDAPVQAADAPDEGEDGDEEEEDGDEDSGDDSSGETQKNKTLPDLAPGRYYVHLFLTKRLDAAEYKLAVKFEPVVKEVASGFPKDVAWVPALPIVPPEDDAPPPAEKKPEKKPCKGKDCKKRDPKPPKPEPEEPASTGAVSARVIDVKVGSGGGTDITIGAGTDQGLTSGRKGSINGVKNGGFTIASCGNRSCKASVKASVDEVNASSKKVTIK